MSVNLRRAIIVLNKELDRAVQGLDIPDPDDTEDIDDYENEKTSNFLARECALCGAWFSPIRWLNDHNYFNVGLAVVSGVKLGGNKGTMWYHWYVCSEDCEHLLERKLKKPIKEKEKEWQQIRKAKQLLAEAKKLTSLRRLKH